MVSEFTPNITPGNGVILDVLLSSMSYNTGGEKQKFQRAGIKYLHTFKESAGHLHCQAEQFFEYVTETGLHLGHYIMEDPREGLIKFCVQPSGCTIMFFTHTAGRRFVIRL